jgi:hypothetical protein
MTDDKKVEVKEQPKSDEELAKDFIKEYDALVEKHQMQIVANPAWKMSQDTGDWRLVIQVSVGKLPKKE